MAWYCGTARDGQPPLQRVQRLALGEAADLHLAQEARCSCTQTIHKSQSANGRRQVLAGAHQVELIPQDGRPLGASRAGRRSAGSLHLAFLKQRLSWGKRRLQGAPLGKRRRQHRRVHCDRRIDPGKADYIDRCIRPIDSRGTPCVGFLTAGVKKIPSNLREVITGSHVGSCECLDDTNLFAGRLASCSVRCHITNPANAAAAWHQALKQVDTRSKRLSRLPGVHVCHTRRPRAWA